MQISAMQTLSCLSLTVQVPIYQDELITSRYFQVPSSLYDQHAHQQEELQEEVETRHQEMDAGMYVASLTLKPETWQHGLGSKPHKETLHGHQESSAATLSLNNGRSNTLSSVTAHHDHQHHSAVAGDGKLLSSSTPTVDNAAPPPEFWSDKLQNVLEPTMHQQLTQPNVALGMPLLRGREAVSHDPVPAAAGGGWYRSVDSSHPKRVVESKIKEQVRRDRAAAGKQLKSSYQDAYFEPGTSLSLGAVAAPSYLPQDQHAAPSYLPQDQQNYSHSWQKQAEAGWKPTGGPSTRSIDYNRQYPPNGVAAPTSASLTTPAPAPAAAASPPPSSSSTPSQVVERLASNPWTAWTLREQQLQCSGNEDNSAVGSGYSM
jgi:hypothetical protein